MKLQALLPLSAEMPSQSEEKVESDEFAETSAVADGSAACTAAVTNEGVESTDAGDSTQQQEEDEDIPNKDTEVVGKKKGIRKKRSLNWEEAERGLLVEVIKSKVDFVENRSVDAKSIKSKRLAWLQITKQFNALNFRQRSLEQIQVQWRAMKNAAKREYQQKFPKEISLEGLKMVEYMEEMHKDPVIGRSHTRGNAGNTTNTNTTTTAVEATTSAVKKELSDLDDDDDDDTPLASLPTSTNNSEDTLQTSTIAIPSPPPSGDSQNEAPILAATLAGKKKTSKAKAKPNAAHAKKELDDMTTPVTNKKMKRQRSQDTLSSDDQFHASELAATRSHAINSPQSLPITSLTTAATSLSLPADDKYKKQFFELIKRARLTEMDYARREHEQKMRFAQIEQDMKLNYYRQELELKLQQQRDEYEMRIRQQQAEHEARMRVYQQSATTTTAKPKLNNKMDNNERQQQ